MDEKKEEGKVKPDVSVLEQAEAIARRIEEANNKAAELLAKQEQQLSRIMLSGRSNATLETPAKKEISAKEYADSILKGAKNDRR